MGALSYINKNGRAPSNDNSNLERIMAQGFNGQTSAIVEAIGGLSDRMKRLEDVTRQGNSQRRVPGMKAA